MRITFEVVTRRETVKTKCRACGKQLRRVASAWSTISPFNKSADGLVNSREQVVAQVKAKLNAAVRELWLDGVMCKKCQEKEASA